MCTFAWLGHVRVVTVTAKQSALQSPLQSHSGVLSAPPPTPRKPRITIMCYPPALPGKCPARTHFAAVSLHHFPPWKAESQPLHFATATKSHFAIPMYFIRLLFVFGIPRTPSTSSTKHFAFLLPPKTRPATPAALGYRCGGSYPLKLKSLPLLVYKTTSKSFLCSAASPKPTFN